MPIRTENRRMEIYLVPGEALLKLAGERKDYILVINVHCYIDFQ